MSLLCQYEMSYLLLIILTRIVLYKYLLQYGVLLSRIDWVWDVDMKDEHTYLYVIESTRLLLRRRHNGGGFCRLESWNREDTG